jgi:putative SOS response-associated peptidase YedK
MGIAEMMQAGDTIVFDVYFAPSYNIAPQSEQPVLRTDPGTGRRELAMMRWGLVPFWSKDGKAGYSTINARRRRSQPAPPSAKP